MSTHTETCVYTVMGHAGMTCDEAMRAGRESVSASNWQLHDLRNRLADAERTLRQMADDAYDRGCAIEGTRLDGKAHGVGLALSYLEEVGLR